MAGDGKAEILLQPSQALPKMFPTATSFEKEDINLTPEDILRLRSQVENGDSENFKEQYTCHIVIRQQAIIGYALEDVEQGKWGPIHFICAIRPDGQVQEVSVLSYSENRGRPVAQKRFLKQFTGKSAKDPLRLRKDIDGVTGATISSRAMSTGVKKLLLIFEDWQLSHKK